MESSLGRREKNKNKYCFITPPYARMVNAKEAKSSGVSVEYMTLEFNLSLNCDARMMITAADW
jgi:hypothetical protein